MRLVFDTNIYIAALLSKGLASNILKAGGKKKVNIFVSDKILHEIERKMLGKFKVNNTCVEDFIRVILANTKLIFPTKKLKVMKIDPDDNKILECAVEAEANLIISMDKHLLKLKKYKGIGVVHPKTLTWIIPKLLK